MNWPLARMLRGSSLSSWRRMPHRCEPGTPRRHPWLIPHSDRARPPSTTGIAAPYAESWCQPAKVCPSGLFTRHAMLQQRMFGPIRSSKMSRMCGSSAISSTHGQSRCDFVFIFLMSGTRASSASNRSRYRRARSALIARTGARQPSRSNGFTGVSVSTFGTASRLRLDENRGVLLGPIAHVRGKFPAERPGSGELEPQPQHMALLMRQRAVHEARARVEDRVVVDELDVAHMEIHVQAQVRAAGRLVQIVERRPLEGRERDLTL